MVANGLKEVISKLYWTELTQCFRVTERKNQLVYMLGSKHLVVWFPEILKIKATLQASTKDGRDYFPKWCIFVNHYFLNSLMQHQLCIQHRTKPSLPSNKHCKLQPHRTKPSLPSHNHCKPL